MKRDILRLSTILFFCLMLLFPTPVVNGASKGLLLWFQVVLPTLLPFIIVSNLLIQTHAIHSIAKLTGPLFSRVFQVSSYGSFAVLTGFLCGYPMGSKVTADLLKNGHISIQEARYLLSFCNNTSPMFLISYVLIQNLGDKTLFFPSFLILIGTPVLCSFLFRAFLLKKKAKENLLLRSGNKENLCHTSPASGGALVEQCMMNGFETIVKVGGYIMLFSILMELCGLLPVKHPLFTGILFPSLEITTGIRQICTSVLPPETRFVLCLTMTAFGGWCAVSQTQCMIHGTELSIVPYIIQKLITAGVTSFIACIYILYIR